MRDFIARRAAGAMERALHWHGWMRAVVVFLLVGLAAPAAHAEGSPSFASELGPAVSGSTALSMQSAGGLGVHFWAGGGIRFPGDRYHALLLGVELDSSPGAPKGSRVHAMDASTDTALWLVGRWVGGEYAAIGWAPLYGAYMYAGIPVMRSGGAGLRIGVGASAIELLRLGGIPNMLEIGLDLGEELSAHVRLGYHL